MPIADDLQSLLAKWSRLASDPRNGRGEDLARSLRLYSGETNSEASGVLGVRQRNWLANVAALHRFVDSRGRWPHRIWRQRTDTPYTDEERLVNWLREQRRQYDSLSTYQHERLEAIPGFEWNPKDEAWDRKIDGYRAFVAAHGRLPEVSSRDSEERRLAVWGSNQRIAHRKGRLPKHRIDELDTLPFWRWGTR